MRNLRLLERRIGRVTFPLLTSFSRAAACAVWLVPVVATAPFLAPVPARAQSEIGGDGGVTIAYPLPGNTLSGASKIMFNGIPDGGYVSIYLDLTLTNKATSFLLATTQTSYELDTGALSDGSHTLTFVSFSASGRQVGSRSVTFNVANVGSAGVSEDSVVLSNWTKSDVLSAKVQRYRIVAESNATITGGAEDSAAGPGGGLGGGGEGGEEDETVTLTAAPLDHQIDLLVRRAVRDVGMLDGSANIRLIVQEGFTRDREGNSGSGAAGGASASGFDSEAYAPGYKGKGNWEKIWRRSLESSQASTKMIKQSGVEINATRKPSTLPLGDILPIFPSYAVQKGATWNSDVTFVGELTKRGALRVSGAPMSLVGFENVSTPAGFERRCARVEVAQFTLPADVSKAIATALQTEAGASGGAGGAGASGGGAPGNSPGASSAGGAGRTKGPRIVNDRATLTRTIWFDIAAHQLVRSEDTIDAYYEEAEKKSASGLRSSSPNILPPDSSFPGGPTMGMGGAAAAPAKPKTVTYNMRIVKFLDDRLPNPTGRWTGGLGTAHTRDNVRDPALTRANGSDVNNR